MLNFLYFSYTYLYFLTLYEDFDDTKGVIRISKSKKDKQYNDQKKAQRYTEN